MSIEISSLPGGLVQNTGETTQTPAQTTPSERTGSETRVSAGSDKVSLTDSASLLRAIESEIATLPVVDVQRVESTQRALATGSYEIDPPRVAHKMLALETAIAE